MCPPSVSPSVHCSLSQYLADLADSHQDVTNADRKTIAEPQSGDWGLARNEAGAESGDQMSAAFTIGKAESAEIEDYILFRPVPSVSYTILIRLCAPPFRRSASHKDLGEIVVKTTKPETR